MKIKLTKAQAQKLGAIAKPHRAKISGKTTPTRLFEAACAAHGLFEPVSEYCFHPSRKWRFDWAWPEYATALEVEGGVFGHGKPCPTCNRKPVGAHTSISGILDDMDKYNQASILGWCVVRCLPDELESGKVFELLCRVIPPANGVRVCRQCRRGDRVNWAEENLCEKCG